MSEEFDRILGLAVAMFGGADIPALIREDERREGNAIVKPGTATWLPARDWHPDTVVSVTPSGRIRLILLRANHPGRGALTRLLGEIGNRAEILAPTLKLEAALKRRGWRRAGDDTWRPPAKPRKPAP